MLVCFFVCYDDDALKSLLSFRIFYFDFCFFLSIFALILCWLWKVVVSIPVSLLCM